MKRVFVINFLSFLIFFSGHAQLLYLQETYRGGISADGKSHQGFDPLLPDSITFHNSIPAGSILKKALLISETHLFDNSVTPTKINSIHLIFNGHNIYPDSSNLVCFFMCENTRLYLSVIDVTQYTNSNNNVLVTPNQNPLLSHPDYDYAYDGFLLVTFYENSSMPTTNAAVILTSNTNGNPLNLSINGLNPINTSKDVGLSIWKQHFVALNDSVKYSVNSNYIGALFAASQNDGLHLPGSFYYQNNTLFGLDDDKPYPFVDSSDALANIKGYVTNNATTLTITTANSFECADRGFVLAYSTPCPPHTLDSAKTFTICSGNSVQLQANPGTGYSYVWTAMGWQIGSNVSITVSPTVTTNYIAYVDSAGCKHTEHFKVGVHPNPKVDSIRVSNAICGGNLGAANVFVKGGMKPYQYNIGTGEQYSPGFSNLNPGSYSLTVTDSVGCKNQGSFSIQQVNPAIASFSVQLIACINTPVNFYNTSSGANMQSWNFGKDSSNIQNPGYTFADTGVVKVTLIVWNNLRQCSDTISKTIYVKECPPDSIKIIAPTIFTPNGDGINETWLPLIYESGYTIENLEVLIYDRWGLKIFESTDSKKGWDGRTTGGLACNEGTYYYVITYGASSKQENKKETLRGFLQLAR